MRLRALAVRLGDVREMDEGLGGHGDVLHRPTCAGEASDMGRPPPLMSPEGSLRLPSPPLLRCGGRPMSEACAHWVVKATRRWGMGEVGRSA
jgi:hypothetical protein